MGYSCQELRITTRHQGLIEITDQVTRIVHATAPAVDGIVTLFIQHTSASLLIQENADPSARHDLETFFNRLVPESTPDFTHTLEGPDDMPAHIKAALTATSLAIPMIQGRLALGTWQGVYVWEHRRSVGVRRVVVAVGW